MSSLYILDISPLSDLELVKILSQSVAGLFVLLTVSFTLKKLCNFMRSHLLILDFTAQAVGWITGPPMEELEKVPKELGGSATLLVEQQY